MTRSFSLPVWGPRTPGDDALRGGDGEQGLRARLRALEVLSDVAVRVASSLDLRETLEHVATAVVDSLGFEVAVLNVRSGDVLEVAVVAGPEDVREALLGSGQPMEVWQRMLERSTPLGGLCFVDGRDGDGFAELLSWVPDLAVSDDPGDWHPMDALFAPLRASSGDLVGVLSVDVPADGRRPGPAAVELLERFAVQAVLAIDRARMHTELAESAELFRASFDDAPLGMALLDDNGVFVQVNRTYAAMVGSREPDLLGRCCWDVAHAEDVEAVRLAVLAVSSGELDTAEGTVRGQDGASYGRVVATRITSRGVLRLLVQMQDVTDQRRAEKALRRQATTDVLTGLANRGRLLEHLEELLRRRAADGRSVAVLFCDLDHFKLVNDSYGHAVGDDLLVGVAQAICHELRGCDVAGRMGGDEFVVVLDDLDGPAGAIAVAERVRLALNQAVVLEGISLTPSASLGIAVADGDVTAEQLLAQADTALYRAKTAGRGRWELFAADMREQLRHALELDQLRLHYQPIVRCADGVVVGHEALIRWEHPDRGLLLPGDFLEVLLEGELASPVSSWVLERAVADAAGWPARWGATPFVSINLSPGQLRRPELTSSVAEALVRHGLPADRLWIEVTEDGVAGGEREVATLSALRALGVHVAIDDFGSGHAGLLSLRDLPADIVKLDRAFVAGLQGDDASRAVIEAAVPLCHRLGRAVVAEGVETAEQLREVTALGVDLAQGWHLGRPAPLHGPRAAAAAVPPPGVLTADLEDELRRLEVALSVAADPVQVAQVVLQAARRVASIAGGSVVLLGADGLLHTVHAEGYPAEVVNRFRTFGVDAPLPIAQAVRESAPVWWGAVAVTGEMHELAPPEGRSHVALAALPLLGRKGCLGGLGLSWTTPTEFDDTSRALLRELADRTAHRLAELASQ